MLICLRLSLSTVHNLSFPFVNPFLPKQLCWLFPFYNVTQKFPCLRKRPSHLSFLCQIISICSSLACTNTSSFVTLFQLIFRFLRQLPCPHFNIPTVFLQALVNVQASAAYSTTFQTVLFITRFFCSQFNFPLKNFFLYINYVLPVEILARMSLGTYPSSDIQLP